MSESITQVRARAERAAKELQEAEALLAKDADRQSNMKPIWRVAERLVELTVGADDLYYYETKRTLAQTWSQPAHSEFVRKAEELVKSWFKAGGPEITDEQCEEAVRMLDILIDSTRTAGDHRRKEADYRKGRIDSTKRILMGEVEKRLDEFIEDTHTILLSVGPDDAPIS